MINKSLFGSRLWHGKIMGRENTPVRGYMTMLSSTFNRYSVNICSNRYIPRPRRKPIIRTFHRTRRRVFEEAVELSQEKYSF